MWCWSRSQHQIHRSTFAVYQANKQTSNMKFLVFLCAVLAVASSAAVRDKRSFIDYSGLGGYSLGLNSRVVAVNKVVNVNRVVDVPQVINVRKVIAEPRVVTVNKVIAEPTYSLGYNTLGSSYASGWW
ncbi:hypothetical protein K1T71_008514 [Dendrolimus kikuchii]|uniref:Uncharacterized protein n=1 Tax=Dendrolimus kikuchii TaxID=765133 RepID=A0ACC1CXF4_9NEOP|nr:hypothetical protein K1T71_008514 [Dendrolimus kikuchii]